MRGGEGNGQEPLLRAQEESWGGPEGAVGSGGTERWFISSTGADGIWRVWLCSLSCLGPRGYHTMIHE